MQESIKDTENKNNIEDKIITTNNQNILVKTEIQRIQQNLMEMGFDLDMINKIIFYYHLRNENEIINYLIKDQNGKWTHPFIPKIVQEDNNNNTELLNSSNIVNNVVTKIKTIDLKNINNNEICEICGEPKEFHIQNINENINNINNFENNNFFNIDNNDNNIFNNNIFNNNIYNNINNDINTNINNNINNNINTFSNNKEEIIKNTDICPICMDNFENPIFIEKCNHKFCQECFNNYLVELIKKNNIDKIPCPYIKCPNKQLSEEFFSQYLSEEQYFKYRQFKAQNDIARDSKKMFCPHCDSYADIEGLNEKYNSNNPNYKKSTLTCKNGHKFCSCGCPLHEGDCYHDDKNFKKFLENEKIKQCPKCGFLIKKNEGCNHMICGNPICKYEFCWLCMKESVPGHYDYGPCAGLQFIDPDGFMFQLKKSNPILFKIVECFNLLFLLLIFILITFVIPGLSLVFFTYHVLYEINHVRNKVYTFLQFMTISLICISVQSILYMAEISMFSMIIVVIIFFIISKILVLIKMLINYCRMRNLRQDRIELIDEVELEIVNEANNNENNNNENDNNERV